MCVFVFVLGRGGGNSDQSVGLKAQCLKRKKCLRGAVVWLVSTPTKTPNTNFLSSNLTLCLVALAFCRTSPGKSSLLSWNWVGIHFKFKFVQLHRSCIWCLRHNDGTWPSPIFFSWRQSPVIPHAGTHMHTQTSRHISWSQCEWLTLRWEKKHPSWWKFPLNRDKNINWQYVAQRNFTNHTGR